MKPLHNQITYVIFVINITDWIYEDNNNVNGIFPDQWPVKPGSNVPPWETGT